MPDSFNPSPQHRHPIAELRRRMRSALVDAGKRWQHTAAPLYELFAPVAERWQRFTAPLRTRWNSFASRNRIWALLLTWSGRLVRWGIYFVLFLILGVWTGLFGRLPSREELRNIETANASEIYTADSVLIGRYYIENRTAIALQGISPHVVNALIATEDRRFFEHHGIDIYSWLRVAYGMLTRKESMGGGSTLSQQLAKNLYPRKHYLIPGVSLVINKIRENFISVKLESIYSKEELLNLYLNTVAFGDVYGIQVASRQYFNKKPKELTADQAATLIGMLKATSLYHPVRRPENAKKRRNVVLQQMVKNGHLTQAEYAELSVKPVGAKYYNRDDNNQGLGTYFREYLRTDLLPKLLKQHPKEDGTAYNLYTDGLKIYTTLHSKMQQYAEEAVQKHMQDLQKQFDQHWKGFKKNKPWGDDKWINEQLRRSERWSELKENGLSEEAILENFRQPVRMTVFSWKNGGSEVDTTLTPLDSVRYYFCLLNCGFMAMDHGTGYIRAWVGGTNFKYFKYDHILSRRQVGSTFKPIVYAAALRDSIKPCDYFPNRIVKLGDWEPHNADERYGGYYSMAGALQKSVNVIAAQLIEKVGIQHTLDLSKKMGITSNLPREYGISLGAADISLYEMIKVYGTLANEGVRPEPVAILKIATREGEILYDYKQEAAQNPSIAPNERALTTDQASTMTRLLENVINYGTGARFRSGFGIRGDFAGKTGTTQNQSDGWFICYNPRMVTGAWVGAQSPAVRFRSMALGQGSAMALPIVAWFWHKVANDRKLGRLLQEEFPEPSATVVNQLGCYPWIGYSPDEWYTLMQDSVFRDSIRTAYQGRPSEEESSEAPVDPEKAARETQEKQEQEERKEKRKDFFRKLFNHKRTREEEETENE